MKTKLVIGFLGAGFNAGFHTRALQSVRGAHVGGYLSANGLNAAKLAQSATKQGLGHDGEAKVFTSIADLCKVCNVIAICAPNYLRVQMMEQIHAAAVAAPGSIIGVICEKPLASNVGDSRKLVQMAESAGLLTAYLENQIHMPTVISCRTQLAGVADKMGPVHLTRSAEEHGGPHEPWFWDPTKQGGGVWSDMGCHSIAVGRHMLTPLGKAANFLQPVSISASMHLLKWGSGDWLAKLRERGVDYSKTPAEDYATATITFKNPQTDQRVMAQATDSWMYDAQGLRLLMEAMGPGYSFTVNSLSSPSGIFISDAAAASLVDGELALEKSQAQRGSLVVVPDEPALYGYVEEWRDALSSFAAGKDALLNFAYGLETSRILAAGYMSGELGRVVEIGEVKDDYIPIIAQGRGLEVLRF